MTQLRLSMPARARSDVQLRRARESLRRQIDRVESFLEDRAAVKPESGSPVVCFNASTRIHYLSQNAAFELLAGWAARLGGVPSVQLVCDRGMRQCMLGTRPEKVSEPPPCTACLKTSRILYSGASVEWLRLEHPLVAGLERDLMDASITELAMWEYSGLPLGALCLPSLRWAMRRHHLNDDPSTRVVLRQYLISAASLVTRFKEILDRLKPMCLVVFNGISYPEAIARAVAARLGIPVVTHEVGLTPCSAFFSHKDATFRGVAPPDDFSLTESDERRLDAVLERRFQGRFSMAGVTFWPEIHPLPDWLAAKLKTHRKVVTIFTNVVFDTSQVHANTLFGDMFEWLASLEAIIERHPGILFVLRAHPDEDRPGKESSESVAEWVKGRRMASRGNVIFLEPKTRISSYELLARSDLVLVYNSSIGLEAALAGLPVLCAGRARYTETPTVFFPESRAAYQSMLDRLLEADHVEVPAEFRENARRHFFFESFRASLDFGSFMTEFAPAPGNVVLTKFDPLLLEQSRELAVLRRGMLNGEPFILPGPSEDAPLHPGHGNSEAST